MVSPCIYLVWQFKEFINPQNMLFQSQTQYYKNYARKAVSHKNQKLQSHYGETMEKKEVYK